MAISPRTQDDLVKDFLAKGQKDQIVSEQVSFYDLDKLFLAAPPGQEVRREVITIQPLVSHRGVISYRDLTGAFLWVIQMKPGVASFEWSISSPEKATVEWVPGFSQSPSLGLEELSTLVENIFKSRRNIQGISWVFGLPYVEITFQNPSTL